MRRGRSLWLAAALLGMLAAGLWVGGHPANMPPVLRDVFVDRTGGLTAEATELIEDNYFEPVSGDGLGDASVRGIVRQLRRRHRDRFSEYLSPKLVEEFNEAIEGRFSGIGIAVVPVKRGLRAEQVFKRSPAERAGIRVGDVVVSVEGRPIRGLSTEQATSLIKGPEGTEVTVGVLRPSRGRARELKLTRDRIALPIVSGRLKTVGGEKLGYVRLAAFSEGAHGYLRRTVRRLQRQGAEGIVLDLRGNGGGLLQEAVLAAGVFLPEGDVVVTTDARNEGEVVYKARGGNLPALPLVVLTDRGTASAAEILAAALADNAGAEIVGSPTFGKGVFQQEIGLSNGGALKLTVGEYFTPDGASLANRGIRPDVRARDLPETTRFDEARERALGVLAERQG